MTKQYESDVSAAMILAEKGQYQKAAEKYREILEKNPTDIRLMMKLSDLLMRVRKFDEAAEWYHNAATEYANRGEPHRAVMLHRQAKKVGAEL